MRGIRQRRGDKPDVLSRFGEAGGGVELCGGILSLKLPQTFVVKTVRPDDVLDVTEFRHSTS
jgi:hypothetical protein